MLPESVTVYEVGPRDGLQNEATVLPTAAKIEFIEALAAAGLPAVEATSFVRPDRVPALADAEQVMAGLRRRESVRYPVLVPNRRGLQRALEHGVGEIAVFASATESFAQANLGRGVAESLDMFAPVIAGARDGGIRVRAYVSMCWGDPWEGPVAVEQVVAVGTRLLDLGADELSLGDTIGVATANAVGDLLAAFESAGVDPARLAVHFHDTYGQALANTLTALHRGIRTVDASAGGLGGCPFAGSATGNLATEDLVWMLDGMGIDTGVDLAALVRISRWLAERLGRPSPSRVVQAYQS